MKRQNQNQVLHMTLFTREHVRGPVQISIGLVEYGDYGSRGSRIMQVISDAYSVLLSARDTHAPVERRALRVIPVLREIATGCRTMGVQHPVQRIERGQQHLPDGVSKSSLRNLRAEARSSCITSTPWQTPHQVQPYR
jgi:hypothetical protein